MKLPEDIIKEITLLKDNPRLEKVDHICILHKLYFKIEDGNLSQLTPISSFYIGMGFDDFPCLKEKHLWNEEAYIDIIKPFIDSHDELVDIINLILENEN